MIKIRRNFNLRKWGSTCEILKAKFGKFTSQLTKIFAVVKHLLGTRVPFRKFKIPFHSCEPTCEILKAKFHKFTIQLAKIFTVTKHLLGTRVPFRNFKVQFRSCKSSCKPTCENGPTFEPSCEITSNLRKYQPSFKFLFKTLILSFFISHNTPTCEKTLQVAKPKNFRRSPPKKAQKSCVWRGPLHSPPRTLWNTSLSISSWPRREEPKPRLHQLATPDRELHLCEIPCLRLHRPLPFHLLRVECHLVLLSTGTRRGDHPLHLGQAIRVPRNQFVVLLQRKPEFQAQESHQHLHSLNHLL